MIAITRSARITPSSISRASPEASATEWIGTLRTSMASGIGGFLSVGSGRYDDGAGVAVECGQDVVEVGDHRSGAALLDEPAGGVDLRAPGAAGEVALRGKAAQPGGVHAAQRLRVGGAV